MPPDILLKPMFSRKFRKYSLKSLILLYLSFVIDTVLCYSLTFGFFDMLKSNLSYFMA